MPQAYEVSEDTLLLADSSRKVLKRIHFLASGRTLRLLEIGCGSGYVSRLLLRLEGRRIKDLCCVDVVEGYAREAIVALKGLSDTGRIGVLVTESALPFRGGSFNLVYFNPPYLPMSDGIRDETITGGLRGFETTVKMMFTGLAVIDVELGAVVFVNTSLNKARLFSILERLKRRGYDYAVIARKKLFFEELYSVVVAKREFLERLYQAT